VDKGEEMEELEEGMERIVVVKDKVIDLFIWGEPYHYAFFQREINENGLENYYIDVEISLTESQKRKEIAKAIYLWDKK